VLLVHGFAATSRMLLPLERGLRRELGRPVLRLQLGRGFRDLRDEARALEEQVGRIAAEPGFEHADIVAHSMGGLVAAYLLKELDRGARVRRVVTLGTPHRGTPAALLGVLALGAVSRAVWQMVPGSPFLRELDALPVPQGCQLLAVAAEADAIVPARYARVRTRQRHRNELLAALDHIGLLHALPSIELVCRSLSDAPGAR
jgi:pimeloyl-ACP methyl ester carboxylesterase